MKLLENDGMQQEIVDGDAILRTDLGGGANQTGARAYNDRLVLSLIRREGALSKAELARRTGLSPQTLGLIVKRLQKEQLLLAETPVKGKGGQPSVPYRLNPDAIFALGLKIGRRSAELTLCDFTGAIRAQVEKRYRYPMPEEIVAFYGLEAQKLIATLPEAYHDRLCGTGIAMPFNLWSWGEALGAPTGTLEAWRNYPIDAKLSGIIQGTDVVLSNDGTAACAAEFMSGGASVPPDFCYVFVGWFVGGGIVLDDKLHPGRRGNAGALGSMLVAGPDGPQPLLERASLMRLEQLSGNELPLGDKDSEYWYSDATERWLADASLSIAQAAANAAAVIDFTALRIDGVMPSRIRKRLVDATRDAYARLDTRGLSAMTIEEGHVGPDARSIGAAILPILSGFSHDREVLLKSVGS